MNKKIISITLLALALMSVNVSYGLDDLVGSSFTCENTTYTFFPDNKFTLVFALSNLRSEVETISYAYDGKILELNYYAKGTKNPIQLKYDALYLPNKKKLILDDGSKQVICIEK
ncbi:MAG: hypothetical protein IPM20_02735 [Gammaproteobacteria bacterium]|nr:hypothetical protein [Gammaproteobacteria bacterium]